MFSRMIEKELLLTARRNLPEHLRILADKYPATSWQTHPNFSDLASFWLERHSMFREVIKRIKELSLSNVDNRENERFETELTLYSGLNQTGFTGEHKAWKVWYDQRQFRKPVFDRGSRPCGAFGSRE